MSKHNNNNYKVRNHVTNFKINNSIEEATVSDRRKLAAEVIEKKKTKKTTSYIIAGK